MERVFSLQLGRLPLDLGVNVGNELARSYQWCYRVARGSGSSFYRAFWLLERPQREAMFALYAFARITDDLGDSTADAADDLQARSATLGAWQALLETRLPPPATASQSATGTAPENARAAADLSRFALLWPALRETVIQYHIPTELLHDLVQGVMMDLDEVRFSDWTGVDRYCYHVASTVGLACTCIWQAADALPRRQAIDCGLAFQLTNILRDLREDAGRQRIYLPLSELERFGCDPQLWIAGRPDGDWLGLVDSVIARTRELYRSGAQTIDYLPAGGARMFWLMWSSYRELLEAIDRQKADLWNGKRVRVSRCKRLALLARSLTARTDSEGLRRGR
jgi:phytoene synthase